MQALARIEGHGRPSDTPGHVIVSGFPGRHGDHFHVGDAVVAVWGAAWLPSRRLTLLGLGTVGVVAGSWIGGELVFRHGWRVRAAEEAELVESRLQAEGRPEYFDQARAEVSDFERSKTILGG